MHRFLWLYPLGIFSAAFAPILPPGHLLLLLAVCALPVALLYPKSRMPIWLLLGFCHGAWWGHSQLAHKLHPELDKSDYRVVGVVSSLPDTDSLRTRFEFTVEQLTPHGSTETPPLQRLLLSWYRGEVPKAGERWQLEVRLRTPRGFANPGGFDYSDWLLGEGISATGHVRSSPYNQNLGAHKGGYFLSLRQHLADRLMTRGDPAAVSGFMSALVLGDKSRIPAPSWDALVATGTVHLMVVSGLHVGMVAGGCFFLGLCLGRIGSALGSPLPAPLLGAALAMAGAATYTLIAGSGLPMQRALLMTLVVTGALMVRRRVAVWQGFAVALFGVALLDPLAVVRQGFWLSFGAVAALLFWFAPRPARRQWGRQLLDAQLVVFVALMAALLFFQGAVFFSAPLVNLVAIPWVSMLVVPLCLLGALLQMAPIDLLLPVADWLWDCAALQLQGLSTALDWVAAQGQFSAWRPDNGRQPWFAAGLALLALILLLPRGLGLKPLAVVLLAGLLAGRSPPPPALELTVLDVGQGLAVVVRAGDRTLVYDTGPRYSEAFNAGSGIVLPYLRSIGVSRIDTLVVSHGDNDHAGGVSGLVAAMAPHTVFSGAQTLAAVEQVNPCHSGQHWRWGDVRFDMLAPPEQWSGPPYRSANDRSCVLLVSYGDVKVLLPGDIGKGVEYRLIATPLWPRKAEGEGEGEGEGEVGQVDVLLAPHHGSRTSSSVAFIRWANPRHVVMSAGYNHHFGHPHAEVVNAYSTHGTRIWNTAHSGALVFRWSGPGEAEISEYRQRPWRSWRER